MRSPARAIAWEFRRHLWALVAMAGYLLVVGMLKPLFLGPGQPVRLDPPDGTAAMVIAPLSVTFLYFLAVFCFGLAGDLAARPSIYPARLFALPVTSAALAGWPMLYGAAAMASLWLVTALVVRWPWGFELPFVWPALFSAVFLAWTQALMWRSYPLPALRVIVAVLWLAALDAAVLLAIHYDVSGPLKIAFLAPQLPIAYLAAWSAVRRARRGEVADWSGLFARFGQIAAALPRRRARFVSPASAQLWFEWRLHGRSLPGWVAILLPFELGLLFVVESPVFVLLILLGVLLTPPFVAAFVGATTSQASPDARDAHGVPPFTAARPLTSATLIAAKLKMAVWSTLAAWLLVVVAAPIAIELSGTAPLVIDRARQGIDAVGTLRATVIALLVFLGLLAATWKRLVQSLCIGLTGRSWLIKSSVLLALSVLIVIPPAAQWIIRNGDVRAALWDALPWIPAVLVGFKMSAAAWIAGRLVRSRLLSDRALVIGAACWCVAVLALYGVLVWLVATSFFPRYWLALVAILAIPLARLSAAPLALAWNRHR